MELNLEQTRMRSFEPVLDTTIFQEETMEMIVPDACPDILGIIDTEGRITLARKEVMDGRVELSGAIRVSVLYLPEGGGGLRRLEAALPFTCAADGTELSRECRLHVTPGVSGAETKVLNPRKVLIRAEAMLACRAFSPRELAVASGAAAEAGAIQQRCEERETYLITCAASHPFGMSDDIELSGGKPEAAELLKYRAIPRCNDAKVIGNKLILKGEVRLALVYRGPEDGVFTADFDLPFSQIMEVSNSSENSDHTVDVVVTKLDCTMDPIGEGRIFRLELELCAQAVLRETCHLTLLRDLYSVSHTAQITPAEHILRIRGEQGVKTQMLQEVLETPQNVRTADDVYFLPGSVSQRTEEGRRILTVSGILSALCVGEDGMVTGISRPIKAECPLELPEGARCDCSCRLGGELMALPTSGGVEVRIPLEFCYTTFQEARATAVGRVELLEEDEEDETERPSVVLRMVSPREELWDLAKHYRTTEEAILSANGLETGTLPAGKLLLIPGKR